MTNRVRIIALTAILIAAGAMRAEMPKPEDLGQLKTAFERYSGAKLVFLAAELPAGSYYDVMPTLAEQDQLRAARIITKEMQKYPRGYLNKIGFKTIGVFAACASRQNDGYHPFDEKLQGYRYYGIWNGKDASAAAFYTEGQLPLTMHHEIFHQVDATRKGKIDYPANSTGDGFTDAVSGKKPYPALKIAAADLAALRKRGAGRVLEDVVSDYCKKNPTEDKAETARYLMSNLADSLVQAATRPELAGSQRIMHVLARYEQALASDGPGVEWFVQIALDRTAANSVKPANPFIGQVDSAVADPQVLRRHQAGSAGLRPCGPGQRGQHQCRRTGAHCGSRAQQTRCPVDRVLPQWPGIRWDL